MKKGIIYFVLLVFMASITACKKQNKIVDMIENVKIASYKLSTYAIEYDEYMRDMRQYYVSDIKDGENIIKYCHTLFLHLKRVRI